MCINCCYIHLDGVNEVDPCLSTPCLNGASCLPHLGRFDCLCAAHFQGTYCEEGETKYLSNYLYLFFFKVNKPIDTLWH